MPLSIDLTAEASTVNFTIDRNNKNHTHHGNN